MSLALALAFALLQVLYIRADRALPTFDDAWYLETALRLYDALRAGPTAFARAYAGAFLIKAPLVSVLPLPFFPLLGRTLKAALMPNVLAGLALSAYAHLLARRLFGRRAGPVAVLVVNTLPLLYALSRRLFVEFPLAALVTAWVYHLVGSAGLRRRVHLWALGVILGLGLLLKVLFPLYVFFPTAAYLLTGRRARRRWNPGQAEAAAKIVLGAGFALASTWYAFNWMTVVGFAYQAGIGSVADPGSGGRSLSPSAFANYARNFIKNSSSPFYAWALLLAAADALRRSGPVELLRRGGAGAMLAAWLAGPLLVFGASKARDARYMAPVLPAVAMILAGTWAKRVPARARPWAAALLLVPTAGYASQSFNWPARPEPLAYGGPPRPADDWSQERLIGELARPGRPRTAAVALEHPSFNANLLSALAAERGLPIAFCNLGYAQDSEFKAAIRIRDKDADAIVIVDGVPAGELPEAFNRANGGVRRLLEEKKLPFRLSARLPLRPGAEALIYERIR